MFSAAGKGLGTAAGVASILTNILGHFRNQEARAQASSLVPTRGHEVGEPGGQKASYLMAVGKMAYDYGSAIKDIKKDIRALQIARAHPRLATAAKRLLTTGRVSARRSRQVQRAFKGTTLLMTTNIRLLGSAMAGLSLGQDLTALLKDWKRLKEGARTKSAEELRAQTWELERTLTELTQLYESLKRRVRLTSPSWVELGEGGRKLELGLMGTKAYGKGVEGAGACVCVCVCVCMCVVCLDVPEDVGQTVAPKVQMTSGAS